jgi:hypothetical protein
MRDAISGGRSLGSKYGINEKFVAASRKELDASHCRALSENCCNLNDILH